MQYLTAALALAPVVLAARPDIVARQSACAENHIFLAKGNNEPYPGRQGTLVNAICEGLASCDYEDILFYNPVEAPYCDSINQGVADGIAQITAYNARCPDSKLVVSGYSQGAQIVGDIFGGGGGVFFQNCVQNNNAGLDINSAPGNKIAAGLVFGSTRHTAGQAYNQLTGGNANGLFPRTGAQLAGLATWTSRYHDYCVADDPVCAGGNVVANHLNYFDIYTNQAAAWVKSQLAAAGKASSAPTSIIPSSTIAPTYPTTTPYSNSSAVSSVSSILAIPTVTLTYQVTVPCVTANTAALTAYTTFAGVTSGNPAGATTVASYVPAQSSAVGTAAGGRGNATASATPTAFLSANGAGSAQVGVMGLVAAGFVALLL